MVLLSDDHSRVALYPFYIVTGSVCSYIPRYISITPISQAEEVEEEEGHVDTHKHGNEPTNNN